MPGGRGLEGKEAGDNWDQHCSSLAGHLEGARAPAAPRDPPTEDQVAQGGDPSCGTPHSLPSPQCLPWMSESIKRMSLWGW